MGGQKVNERQLHFLILSILIAVVGYLLVALWSGWQDVVKGFISIGLWGISVALCLSLVNYSLRFVRWQKYLLNMQCIVPWKASLRIYLSGFALTTTPGKAGEIFRGFLLGRYGIPFSKTFAAFISERVSDLTAIIFLAFLGFSYYPKFQNLVYVGVGLCIFILIFLANRQVLQGIKSWTESRKSKLARVVRSTANMLLSMRECHRPKVLLFATFLSVIAWGAEALAFHWVLMWMGVDVPLYFSFFVYSISMLVGAFSFLPGGLGSAEGVMISLLVFKGMPMHDAVAATIVIRLATLWFAVFIGLFALYSSRNEQVATI